LCGRVLPNEPLKRLPLAVFLSTLPIIIFDFNICLRAKIKKNPADAAGSKFCVAENYNLLLNSLPALKRAAFLAIILIGAPV
jgi:hypothetical protein